MPIENRKAISLSDTTTALWTKNDPGVGDGLYRGDGMGILDDYGDMLSHQQVDDTRMSPEAQQALAKVSQRLQTMGLTGQQINQISDRQLKAVGLALSGHWGDEVSLVGMDSNLQTAMNHIVQNDNSYQGMRAGLRSTNDQDPVLAFAVQDGLLEPGAIQQGSDYVHPPVVGDQDRAGGDARLRQRNAVNRNRRMDRQRQQHGQQVQQQQRRRGFKFRNPFKRRTPGRDR